MPAGVMVPSGATSVILSPSRDAEVGREVGAEHDAELARHEARRACRRCISLPMSVTCGSSDGSMPRSATPLTASCRVSSACASTYGAAPITSGFWRASCAVSCQLGIEPVGEKISTCASTDSMRSRTSFWKPFITDSTTISAATPSAMPAIETSAMNEMKPLPVVRLPARV